MLVPTDVLNRRSQEDWSRNVGRRAEEFDCVVARDDAAERFFAVHTELLDVVPIGQKQGLDRLVFLRFKIVRVYEFQQVSKHSWFAAFDSRFVVDVFDKMFVLEHGLEDIRSGS